MFGIITPPTADDAELGTTMRAYWTKFARSGNPNHRGALKWPRFKDATDRRINFRRPAERADALPTLGMRVLVERLRCPVRRRLAERGVHRLGFVSGRREEGDSSHLVRGPSWTFVDGRTGPEPAQV
jgi:hypothetical protein